MILKEQQICIPSRFLIDWQHKLHLHVKLRNDDSKVLVTAIKYFFFIGKLLFLISNWPEASVASKRPRRSSVCKLRLPLLLTLERECIKCLSESVSKVVSAHFHYKQIWKQQYLYILFLLHCIWFLNILVLFFITFALKCFFR